MDNWTPNADRRHRSERLQALRWSALAALVATGLVAPLAAEAAGKGSGGSVSVRGYVRKDGTYVQPHMRSAPDGSFQNNWSTEGNYNPYTGEAGTLTSPRVTGTGAGYVPAGALPAPVLVTPPADLGLAPPSPDSSPLVDPALPGTTGNLVPPAAPLAAPRATLPPQQGRAPQTYAEMQRARDAERARYWKERGYSFDPSHMSAYSMDQKVRDIERARYWQQQGYSFNPDYMSAFSMDQKVRDIQRARYWQQQGYSFNPDYMSAFSMDQKVRDIQRASYWRERGLTFNPDYMSAFSMDMEAKRMGVSR